MNWIVVVLSIIIGSVSIIYTRDLVQELKDRESKIISLYAKTFEYTSSTTNAADITFVVREILLPNNLIPVIWTDGNGVPINSRNVPIQPEWTDDERSDYLLQEIEEMKQEHDPITITYRNEEGEITDYQYVYYKNSALLKRRLPSMSGFSGVPFTRSRPVSVPVRSRN